MVCVFCDWFCFDFGSFYFFVLVDFVCGWYDSIDNYFYCVCVFSFFGCVDFVGIIVVDLYDGYGCDFFWDDFC